MDFFVIQKGEVFLINSALKPKGKLTQLHKNKKINVLPGFKKTQAK